MKRLLTTTVQPPMNLEKTTIQSNVDMTISLVLDHNCMLPLGVINSFRSDFCGAFLQPK